MVQGYALALHVDYRPEERRLQCCDEVHVVFHDRGATVDPDTHGHVRVFRGNPGDAHVDGQEAGGGLLHHHDGLPEGLSCQLFLAVVH